MLFITVFRSHFLWQLSHRTWHVSAFKRSLYGALQMGWPKKKTMAPPPQWLCRWAVETLRRAISARAFFFFKRLLLIFSNLGSHWETCTIVCEGIGLEMTAARELRRDQEFVTSRSIVSLPLGTQRGLRFVLPERLSASYSLSLSLPKSWSHL